MEHSFDIQYAKVYGLEESILIHHLQYWIIKNKANNKHEHDGRNWTYNSYKAFAEIFPYWNEHKMRRILDSLVEQNVLLRENYNKKGYDRTSWYAFVDENKFIHNCQKQLTNLPNANDEIAKPIPDTLSSTNKLTYKSINISFDDFWVLYDKKVGNKTKLEKKWNSLSDEQRETAMKHIPKYKKSQPDKMYRKNPETYLNNESYYDEIIVEMKDQPKQPTRIKL